MRSLKLYYDKYVKVNKTQHKIFFVVLVKNIKLIFELYKRVKRKYGKTLFAKTKQPVLRNRAV